MRRQIVKKQIFNPVLGAPWVSKVQNGAKLGNLEYFVLNLSLDENDAQDLSLVKKATKRYLRVPVRPTKAALTRIYTDQLKPNYPNFKKFHVRAALMLTDNNIEEAKLFLDLKGRFDLIKKQKKVASLTNGRVENNHTIWIPPVENRTNVEILNHTAPTSPTRSVVAPLGSFPAVQGISAISAIPAFIDTPMATPNLESDSSGASTTPELINVEAGCYYSAPVKIIVDPKSDNTTPELIVDESRSDNCAKAVDDVESASEDIPIEKEVISVAECVYSSEEFTSHSDSIVSENLELPASSDSDFNTVYTFSESETKKVSTPNFFQWKLSMIGSSKIKLKRNKIGVQILRKRDGYVANLL